MHIRFCGGGCWRFRFYSDSLLQTPKRKQNALPLHSVPRLGSACRNEGITPGARRHRPSMAGGGYRGILAAVPPAQRLRSASGKGAGRSKAKAKQRQDQKIAVSLRSTAPTGKLRMLCRSCRRLRSFDLDAPPHREAEWRFCAVGNPAWMAAGPRSRTGARACQATERNVLTF